MKKLKNIHPEEILIEEFTNPLRITADTTLRLSVFFGNLPKFWLGLQNDYDLEEQTNNNKEIFVRIQNSRKDIQWPI